MRRAAQTLAALVAVACCLTLAVAVPARAGQAAPQRQPLSIETLDPSRLTPGTPVRVTGTVFNNTDETWGDAQVGMLTSPTPLVSEEEVGAAAEADPYQGFTGEKVLAPGTFDDIGDILPGQSRSYAFTVPYGDLDISGQEGAYWVGAELRVTGDDGLRSSVARSLTFLPLVADPGALGEVDLAVLWPLVAPVPWDGTEFLTRSLVEQLGPQGRLRALAELGVSAGEDPVTWVLEPAVLDAARRLGRGTTVAGRELPADTAEATAARQWLQMMRGALGSSVALAVPYGNPDLATLAHRTIRPGARKAQRAGERVLDGLGVSRLDLLWPPGGRADRSVLHTAQEIDAEVALLSRDTFAEPPSGAVVGVRVHGGDGRGPRTRPALVVGGDDDAGGLRAQPGQTTLQWRQLILANTALRALSGDPTRDAAVAMPAPQWWPDDAWRDADLFDGLRVPWVDRVPASALINQAHPTYDGELRYPRALRRRELGAPMVRLLRELRRTIRTVGALLADPEASRADTDLGFGLSASTAWREHPGIGRRVASAYLEENESTVRSIDIEAPDFVTLSSDTGRFPISITNGADAPVTVELAVTARDPRMTVEPVGPVTLQRDQRVTVTVLTSSRGVGITTMTARMLTQDGRPFGPTSTFQVRTTQIGALVWVVMGLGGAILFGAAGRRIVLRTRAHRRRSPEPR